MAKFRPIWSHCLEENLSPGLIIKKDDNRVNFRLSNTCVTFKDPGHMLKCQFSANIDKVG
jgi:hypothetical protein